MPCAQGKASIIWDPVGIGIAVLNWKACYILGKWSMASDCSVYGLVFFVYVPSCAVSSCHCYWHSSQQWMGPRPSLIYTGQLGWIIVQSILEKYEKWKCLDYILNHQPVKDQHFGASKKYPCRYMQQLLAARIKARKWKKMGCLDA